jgi:DNA-binding transcriptional MerR regulator
MEKKQFTMKEIIKITGLTSHTLRYYESIGLLQNINRNKQGYRSYSEEDIKWLSFITKLRESNMPISTILEYASLIRNGQSTKDQRKEILVKHKENILHQISLLNDSLQIVEDKIDYYNKLSDKN